MGNGQWGDEGYTAINRELLNDTTTYEDYHSAAYYVRYFETKNTGDAPIHFTFLNGTTIPPGGFMVVARPYCPVMTFFRCNNNNTAEEYTEFCSDPSNPPGTACGSGGSCIDICGGTESQQPLPPWDPDSQWYDEDAYGHLVEGDNLLFWPAQSNRSHNQTIGYRPGWKQNR